MKTIYTTLSVAILLVTTVAASAQTQPGRLPQSNYGSSLAAGNYATHATYGNAALADCQCNDRKGYNLWCQPVSFSSLFGRKSSCGCSAPAPSCCAPEPSCCAPEPTCCAPEPTCAAPEPTCCAPEPTCAAPEPTCCAPEPTCCAPEPTCGAPAACGCCNKRGLFNHCSNPLSDLHGKLAELFERKPKCCPKSCSCTSNCCGGCSPTAAPQYFQPTTPESMPSLPDSIDNPFRDDDSAPAIPVPGTTTSAPRRSLVRPVIYAR